MPASAKEVLMSDREFVLTRIIDVPSEKLLCVWAEPALLVQWFHAGTVENHPRRR